MSVYTPIFSYPGYCNILFSRTKSILYLSPHWSFWNTLICAFYWLLIFYNTIQTLSGFWDPNRQITEKDHIFCTLLLFFLHYLLLLVSALSFQNCCTYSHLIAFIFLLCFLIVPPWQASYRVLICALLSPWNVCLTPPYFSASIISPNSVCPLMHSLNIIFSLKSLFLKLKVIFIPSEHSQHFSCTS